MNQLIIYALAISAQRHGIQVHALCAMCSHIHMVVTDPNGLLPSFLRDFHQWVAFGTKILRNWEGSVWDNERTSVVQLLTTDAIIQKIAYTLANPVAAGLVRRAHQWPGARTRVRDLGRGKLETRRPKVYFDKRNPQWKEQVEIPIVLPPTIAKNDARRFRRKIAIQLNNIEDRAHSVGGIGSILGAKRAMMLSPYDCAKRDEPARKRKPTLAVGHNNADLLKRAIAQLRAFRTSYRAALTHWRNGTRNVVFPMGTWWMRVFHRASVAHNGNSLGHGQRNGSPTSTATQHRNAWRRTRFTEPKLRSISPSDRRDAPDKRDKVQ